MFHLHLKKKFSLNINYYDKNDWRYVFLIIFGLNNLMNERLGEFVTLSSKSFRYFLKLFNGFSTE